MVDRITYTEIAEKTITDRMSLVFAAPEICSADAYSLTKVGMPAKAFLTKVKWLFHLQKHIVL